MGYAKFNKKDNSSMITYVGHIYKDVSSLVDDNRQFSILDTLMRLQSSAMRTSYNDITKRHLSRKESTAITASRFINNQRYMRDAFALAEQGLQSQSALLPMYLEDMLERKNKTTKKINKIKSYKKAKHKSERIKGLQTKLKKIESKIKFYEQHIERGTCPPAVFGGKSNMRLLKLGKISKEEWINSRRNSLYSVGEKSKDGNENIKLTYLNDNYFSMSILNPLDAKRGSRISFIVKFPEKMVSNIASYLTTKEAYSVRVMKENDKYSVHVTMSALTTLDNELFKLGVAGVDINPDNISVSIIDSIGNFKYSKIFKFPEINYVSSNKRNYIIGNVVKKAVNYIKSMGVKIITIEDLKFQNSFQNDSSLNRLLSNFVHSKIVNIFGSRCFKEGLILKKVNPAYTSLLGRIKYQKKFGLSVHEAAAICIARKGLGLKEKLPKKLLIDFFAMEVKDKIKISDAKYKEYLGNLYSFFMNTKFKKSIYALDKYHLSALGIPRAPKEWLFEDYLKYSEFYILKTIKSSLLIYYLI